MQGAISWAQFAIGLGKRQFLLNFAASNNVAVETLSLKDFQKNEK